MKNLKRYVKRLGIPTITGNLSSKISHLSAITIIFLVLEIMSIGGIIFQLNSPPRYYSYNSLTPWDSFPLEPYETRVISYYVNNKHWAENIPIANGQQAIINVSSNNLTSLKLIHVEAWEKRPDFSSNAIYESYNKTHHFLTINPSSRYRIFYLIIRNLTPNNSHFEGSVAIYGFNHDYLLIPVLLIFLYFLFSICSITTNKLIIKLKSNSQRNFDESSPSFFYRIKSIWILLRQEFDPLQIIIITAIVWVVIQPFVPVPLSHFSSSHPLNTKLRLMERDLISGLPLTLFLLAILISVETGELVASKKRRGDIMVILSFPISRIEWIFGYGVGILIFYGGIVGITLMLKAVILSMRIRLVYPITSVLAWFFLIVLTLAAWTFTGIITSFGAHDKFSSAIKGIGIITCVSVLMFILDEGIMSIEKQSYRLWPVIGEWTLPDVQFHDIFITTLPHLHVLFPTFCLTWIWVVISLALLIFIAQRYEVK